MKIGSKEYFEKYAKMSLVDVYNKKLTNAELKDKPDIQDKENDIGIEVTRSELNQECLADSISNKIFDKELSIEEIKLRVSKKFKTFNGTIGEIDGVKYISPFKGMIDYKTKLDRIIHSIEDKTQKFEENYTKFNENDLYIFTNDACITYGDIEKVIYNKRIDNCPFDVIFINCIDKIYMCRNKEINEIFLSDTQLKRFKIEAKKD